MFICEAVRPAPTLPASPTYKKYIPEMGKPAKFLKLSSCPANFAHVFVWQQLRTIESNAVFDHFSYQKLSSSSNNLINLMNDACF